MKWIAKFIHSVQLCRAERLSRSESRNYGGFICVNRESHQITSCTGISLVFTRNSRTFKDESLKSEDLYQGVSYNYILTGCIPGILLTNKRTPSAWYALWVCFKFLLAYFNLDLNLLTLSVHVCHTEICQAAIMVSVLSVWLNCFPLTLAFDLMTWKRANRFPQGF